MRRATASWRTLAFGIAAILASLSFPSAAQASLPGANGRIAFMSTQDGDYDIYTVDSAGANLQQLTNNPATDGGPRWSPDGTQIAFATNRDGNYEIYKMSATGSNVQRLTTNANFDGQPSWSPTGTQIVFSSDRDGNFEIYKMNADGTAQTRLTNNALDDEYPAWSPDGTKIAYQSLTPNLEIFTMNTSGSGQVNLTNNAAHDSVPSWSPDGAQIAFVSTRTGGGDVYSMNANGSNQALFKGNAASDNSPAWSPKGDLITWALHTGTTYDLVKGNASLVNQMNPLYASAGQDESPDWQPLNNTYARPTAATPISIPLVPAYTQCTSPNTTHRGITNEPSCYGPIPESNWLTVGTSDFNGAAPNSTGKVRMSVFCNGGGVGEPVPCLTTPGDQLDGRVVVSISDVRCKGVSGGCSGALADYTGQLYFFSGFRVTDKNNGPTGVGPSANGTTSNLNVDFAVPCTATPSTSVGSTCSVTTTIDTVLGSATAIAEQKRGIWELAALATGDGRAMNLYDGGANGVYGIGDTVFAVGGLFFP
jgi:Tol biopolymer transport system component